MNRSHVSCHAGFAMIEAMIAGLVMAFGMLAMVSMQVTLSRNADVSKARVEATRLAQEKMEELRSFNKIAASSGTATWADEKAWDTLPTAGGSDTVTTNTQYTRAWSFAAAATPDVMKKVMVTVSWTDTAGTVQSVSLSSVISKTDPADSGFLAFPLPQNTHLKRPMNRNVNIPIPAVDLGGGKSGYQISPTLAVVFSNDSGMVIQKCTSQTAFQISTNYDLSTCDTSSALMIAGYISRYSGSEPWPTGINYAGVTSADNSSIACKYSDAVNQNTDGTISNYKYYLCIIPVSDVTNSAWSGTIRLGGLPAATNSDTSFVCRYQYTDTNQSSNARNVQPYANVTESLDSQNYIIKSGNNGATCPSNTTTATMVLHQDCRPGNANRATDCPAASANNF